MQQNTHTIFCDDKLAIIIIYGTVFLEPIIDPKLKGILFCFSRFGRQQFPAQVQQESVLLMWMEMVSWKLLLLHLMGV